ncbi:MAG TPA: glycogen/starch synthase [Phycisphaerales bacterium]|nr:glycogen/starch synthase [Phycisphaerales bacterium]
MADRNLQSDPASRDHKAQLSAASVANMLAGDGAQSASGGGGGGPLLFEISTEVCNQVGGIYQVIRSKAPLMVQRWGDGYCLVGPWEGAKAQVEFEELPASGWLANALDELRSAGLHIHHGRWMVPGRPRVLLIEHWQGWERLNEAKFRLWTDHGIDTPGDDGLVNFVVSFADAVRRLFEVLCRHRDSAGAGCSGPMVAHFHEWLAGPAIPMMRKQGLPVATVFTTHATILGRYIAGGMDDFYDRLPWLDHDFEARKYNVTTQHRIERASAHGAHVFTTVSSVTAEECNYLLGRPVDVVTPNGLTINLYNAGHEQQRLHGVYKEQIHRFTMGHFFPSYQFDLDNTVYIFTSGRFEPRNKGFDLCLEAMARLNAELKNQRINKNVVFFIITKRATHSINPLSFEKRGILNDLDEVCEKISEGVAERLFKRAAGGGPLKLDDLVEEYWMLRYRRAQSAFKHHGLPMVVTHLLQDEDKDPVLSYIRNLQLFNRADDPVKVVYHPDFITPTNRLWSMDYDQFVRGTHLGLFPSMYEPWGYTPLECAAMGIPSVTSDTAGFGRFVQETYADPDRGGMYVLKRRGRSYHDAAADLCKMLVDFCRMERRDRIALRNEVDKRSWDFDWTRLGRAYHTTHELAIARIRAEQSLSAQGGKASGLASLGAVTADDLSKMNAGQNSAAIAKVTEDVKLPSGEGARA